MNVSENTSFRRIPPTIMRNSQSAYDSSDDGSPRLARRLSKDTPPATTAVASVDLENLDDSSPSSASRIVRAACAQADALSRHLRRWAAAASRDMCCIASPFPRVEESGGCCVPVWGAILRLQALQRRGQELGAGGAVAARGLGRVSAGHAD